MTKGYLFYDDETANNQQRICQIGYVLTDFEGNQIGEAVSQLIDPESEFGYFNTAVHGIRPDDVSDMPTLAEFSEQTGFINLLKDYTFVAHNAYGADLHHIRKSLAAYDIEMPELEVIDTMKLAAHAGLPAKLNDLCDYFDVRLNHHNAMSDALACRDVFFNLKKRIGDIESFIFQPQVAARTSHKKRVLTGLGFVNGTNDTKPVEEVLQDMETDGLRGDPMEIDSLDNLNIVVSGIVPGYTRNEINEVLKNAGANSQAKVNSKTQYLAIGHNVGQTKIDEATIRAVKVITVGELLDVLNRTSSGEA